MNYEVEIAALRAKIESLQDAYDTARDHQDRLALENARLLEALKKLCDEFSADENTRSEADAIYEARAAIAEAEK